MTKRELEILGRIVDGLCMLAYNQQDSDAIHQFEYASIEILKLIEEKKREEE